METDGTDFHILIPEELQFESVAIYRVKFLLAQGGNFLFY